MAKWGKAWASVLCAFVLLGLNVFPALAATGLPVPPSYTAGDMVLTVTTPSPNFNYEVPINGAVGTVTINWGDGNSTDSITSAGNQLHTYANADTYTIVISGTMSKYGSDGGFAGATALTAVQQWGSLGITNLRAAFLGATNLVSVPTTLPPGVTDLSEMFLYATKFNQDISGWDTSSVTDMSGMFRYAAKFNNGAVNNDGSHPLLTNGSAWDVSNVTTFSGMFQEASDFSENVSNWDTSSATSMESMFWG